MKTPLKSGKMHTGAIKGYAVGTTWSVAGIEVFISEHGVKTASHGAPIYLEVLDNDVVLYIWADINQEDPTHIINLSQAKEIARDN